MTLIQAVENVGDVGEMRRMMAYLARQLAEQQTLLDAQQAIIERQRRELANWQQTAQIAAAKALDEAAQEHNYDKFHRYGTGGY